MTNTYDQIAERMIKEQESLMGPVAWHEAKKVKGLDIHDHEVSIRQDQDQKKVIDELVNKYGSLFGNAAIRVCRESVIALVSDLEPAQIPTSLQK